MSIMIRPPSIILYILIGVGIVSLGSILLKEGNFKK